MEVHAAGAAQTPKPIGKKPVHSTIGTVSPSKGLKPQEVPLLITQSDLATGQSLTKIPLIDISPAQEKKYLPRTIEPQEIERVLDAYNSYVRSDLKNAPQGSRLEQFETALRLISYLQNPHLREDKQASDILQMRQSEIEGEYKRLIQEPEIQQSFEKSRQLALNEIFGKDLNNRVQGQANYLLNDSFQQELDKLPEAEIQARIQQELSALAILNPAMAKKVGQELIQKTVIHQALKTLQDPGEAGDSMREGLSQALGLYLKAQQTAASVTLQASNFSRLVNISDQQIDELTQAVAKLASETQAKNPQQLALNLVSRVDELPPELRENASSLIRNLHTQNLLGTILFAGSVVGLAQQELPKDPKSWASLGTGSMGSATMAHFALRTFGMNQAADVAAKINFKASIKGVNIPVVGALVTGVNTTLDAMAFIDEIHNEDTLGATSRALSVGSGLATLAAITVMKGKSVPIALIGSTLTGLAAWGIDSLWGESDTSGKIRQDLRTLGISDQESASLKRLSQGENIAKMKVSDRVKSINALMDQFTNSKEETQMLQLLMMTPDEDFVPLLQKLHLPRVLSELQNDSELNLFLYRVMKNTKPKSEIEKIYPPLLQSLALARRYESMHLVLNEASPAFKQSVSPLVMQTMVEGLLKGWTRQPEKQAVVSLLNDPSFQLAVDTMLLKSGKKFVSRLRSKLGPNDFAALLSRMQNSQNKEIRTLAASL